METRDDHPKTQQIFEQARKTAPEAPPYLETRVLAVLRERQADKMARSARLWRLSSLLSGALSLGLIAWIVLHRVSVAPAPAAGLIARVNQAVVVRMELGDLERNPQILHVRIDLPSGVHFFSAEHRGLESASSVVLALDRNKKTPYLPFAVQSEQDGVKPILIRFLDERSAVVAERIVDIRFKKGA